MRALIPALLAAAWLAGPALPARAGLPLQITIDCPSQILAELPPLALGTWSPPSGWSQATLYDAPLAPVPVVYESAHNSRLWCAYGVPNGNSGTATAYVYKSEPASYDCVASPSSLHKGFICTLDPRL